MKNLYKLSTLILLSVVVIACGGSEGDDPAPDATLADFAIQANAWNLVSASSDSEGDLTSVFTGLVINFSNGNYTANISDYGVWDSSGTYSVSNVSETSLSFNLSNGNTGSASLTESQLTLIVNVPTTIFGGGRTNSLAGNYTFILSK
jgi:hypothetical protein